MSKARNQHWLPQFYLRYFAVPGYRRKKNAKIWLADIETDAVSEEKIQEVASAEFLYSHLRPDGSRSHEVDDKLGELESTVSQLYPRIAEGYPDLAAAWGIKKFASVFIASLMLRHPSMQEHTRNMHRRLVDAYESVPKDDNGLPQLTHLIVGGRAHEFDTANYDEYKNADENSLKKMFAEQIHPLAVDLSGHLFEKRWIFFCADSPVFFTSDKPVCMNHCERTTFGLRTPGVNLWFPLAPNRILWITDKQGTEPDGYYPLPVKMAVGLNLFTLSNAPNFLLCHKNPDPYLRDLDAYIEVELNNR
jgi:hypothetical protein